MSRFFLAAWLGLAVSQLAWWWPRPLALTIAILPLALTGAYLLRPTPRRRAAACLLSLPYFVIGTTEWMVDRRTAAAVTLLFCTVLYLLVVAINVRDRRAGGA